ncbi:MAG: GIY-YIG nuclease family protein [Candidatus Pacebacteria bacterium]|nr:GIY-YIG nuclease family protein [Candidatus Paceibacterota bacterium]
MYKVYILKSLTAKKSYVGLTVDLDRRLKEHNSGKHFYTRRYLPWEIVSFEERENLLEARKREKYLKSAAGRRYLKKFIFGNI